MSGEELVEGEVEDVSTELQTVQTGGAMLMNDDEIRRTWRVAAALARSGMFKDARQAESAFAKILIGRDLGLSPTQAMMGIHIVEGKPEIAATMLASFVRKLPGYDYKIVEHTDQRCCIEFYFDGTLLGESSFTMQDATLAGLVRDGSPWKKYPRNMLFARAISNGVKWHAPDATGGIPVYHEGEIETESRSLTRPSEDVPVSFGEDPEVAEQLQQAFDILGYTRAKVRTLLKGCESQEDRLALLERLRAEVDQQDEEPVAEAEVVPDAA